MSQENKIFMPLFYNSLEFTESISDAEFGKLVRELLRSRGSKEYSPNLAPNLILAYNFMLDNAIRIFSLSYRRAPQSRNNYDDRRKEKNRLGDFDAEEAFQKALMRTYGESE